jgi:Surface antigen variable number repeat
VLKQKVILKFGFIKKYIIVTLYFIIGLSHILFSQQNIDSVDPADSLTNKRLVIIDNIFVTGNKETKDKIVLRELSVVKGNVYDFDALSEIIVSDRNKIYNTKLFNEVEIAILEIDFDKIDIVVRVTERWYLFPIPLIDIIDRNFNDWWVNQGHDLNRIIYGLSLYHFNMRGMNERMTVTAQFGFTKRFEVDYSMPYIDRSQRHGLSFSGKYLEYNNLHYKTIDNNRIFVETEDLLRTSFAFGARYTLRNSFYTRHGFALEYSQTQVSDTVLQLNANYLGTGTNDQKYLKATYKFDIDKRDIAAYPLKGFRFQAKLYQIGFGFENNVSKTGFETGYERFFELKKGFYFNNLSSISVSSPSNQPYTLLNGLGFNNRLVRGYELYTIFAQNYFLNKSTFKKVLFKGSAKWKSMPLEQFQYIPYGLYIKTYFDLGYAKNTLDLEGNAPLADRLLAGTGIGLDFVTMYDFIIRAEYSLNNIGEHGFFLSLTSDF